MEKRRRRGGKGKVRRRLIGKSRKEVDNKMERRHKITTGGEEGTGREMDGGRWGGDSKSKKEANKDAMTRQD